MFSFGGFPWGFRDCWGTHDFFKRTGSIRPRRRWLGFLLLDRAEAQMWERKDIGLDYPSSLNTVAKSHNLWYREGGNIGLHNPPRNYNILESESVDECGITPSYNFSQGFNLYQYIDCSYYCDLSRIKTDNRFLFRQKVCEIRTLSSCVFTISTISRGNGILRFLYYL